MTFVNPGMFAAAVAGAMVPLILHLLSRARYRSVEWGAMMFVSAGPLVRRQTSRLKQWTLLGMRMGTVGLVGMALARPSTGGGGGIFQSPPSQERATAVIILDHSASMSLEEGGRTRLAMARDAVWQILQNLSEQNNKAQEVAVVVLGGEQDASRLAKPNGDLQDVARQVMQLNSAEGFADMAAALRSAADILDRADAPRREIYIVCDRQASSWAGVDEDFLAQWRERVGKAGAGLKMFVIPVGSDESNNVGIESVEILNPPAIVDLPMDVQVTVRNYGSLDHAAVALSLSDAKPGQAVVHLGPHQTAAVRFRVTFSEARSRVLTARIESTGLAFDKTYNLAVDVGGRIRVLVVHGDERQTAAAGAGNGAGGGADFLRAALEPFRSASRDPAIVTVTPASKFNPLDLDRYQVAVLANVGRFAPAAARAIEQFVYEGGGLLLACGDQCDVDNYDAMLYRDGNGILPAKLQGPPVSDEEGSLLEALDLSHPIFRFLLGRLDPTPAATVQGYYIAVPRSDDARVLGRYTSGRPFLMESAAGRGKVLLMTTAIDGSWNTLPLTSFYLPFAQSMVRDLARAAPAVRNLAPRQPLVADFDQLIDPRSVVLHLERRPGGWRRSVEDAAQGSRAGIQVTQSLGRAQVRFNDTRLSGTYRLSVKPAGQPSAREFFFVVQTPREESDLAPLGSDRWDELGRSLGFERIDASQSSIHAALDAARRGRELWAILLGGGILLSLAELAVGRAWMKGGGHG